MKYRDCTLAIWKFWYWHFGIGIRHPKIGLSFTQYKLLFKNESPDKTVWQTLVTPCSNKIIIVISCEFLFNIHYTPYSIYSIQVLEGIQSNKNRNK